MADNRIARGIVLVPCLLLGGAFLATAAWGQGAAAENRTLAITIGAGLLLAGWLSQISSGDDKPDTTTQDKADRTP
ncbi:MAG: GIVxVP protein [Cyanobacteriota bacterium]|nr:GIVxVP protein [Cyanobacteriota bacterium]